MDASDADADEAHNLDEHVTGGVNTWEAVPVPTVRFKQQRSESFYLRSLAAQSSKTKPHFPASLLCDNVALSS